MKTLACLVILALLGGCAAKPVKTDMSAFIAAAPRSILVVPVVNKSLDVDAPNYVLAALPVPISEKGYYVFPVNTTKFVLEQEGFYEGDRIHNEPPAVLAKLFDADAVLYVTILRWDAQYAVLTTSVTVEFEYRLVYRDGTEIWKVRQRMVYSSTTEYQRHSGKTRCRKFFFTVRVFIFRTQPRNAWKLIRSGLTRHP